MIERKKREEMLEEVVFGILFAVGMFSCVLLGTWIVAFYFFVFGNATYTGDIAFVPKWTFLGAPLIFLIETKPIKRIMEKIGGMQGPKNLAG